MLPKATEHFIQGPCYLCGGLQKDQSTIGEYGKLLTLVKKWKLRWCGHVSRSSGLEKTICTEQSNRKETKRQTEEEVGRQCMF